jgi:transposase InsO family protein
MPFHGVSAMESKIEFVQLAMSAGANRRELCRRAGVSPTTAYKWIARYLAAGFEGLAERSRRPHRQPRRSGQVLEALVQAIWAENVGWGGRKIAHVLERDHGIEVAASTVTAILRRLGVELGKQGGGAQPFIRFEHPCPNDLWQMDYKGHVALRAGRLHPLTVLDDHSRYSVVLAACGDEQTATVRGHLITAFERYGLPWRIATDNGSPWGDGPGSPFTPLGVWLLERDIQITHSRPYHPQTLGKDERFHRTLKAEVMGTTFQTLAEAQQAFDRWRERYNHYRPHQALDMQTPDSRFAPSPRACKPEPEPFEYAPDDILRRVQQLGRFSYKGAIWKAPRAFYGKTIALRPTERDGVYDLIFRSTTISTVDLNAKT